MQQIIVYIILALVVAYTLWRIYRAWNKPEECTSGCTDCPLKERCAKHS